MSNELFPETQYPESKLPEFGIWTPSELQEKIASCQAAAKTPEDAKIATHGVRMQFASQYCDVIKRGGFAQPDFQA